MTIAQQVGQLNREIELSQSAKNFGHLCRYIAMGKGDSSTVIGLAEKSRALPQIIDGLKAASAPGQTLGGAWGGELSPYVQLQDAFLLSLRNVGVYDRMAASMKAVPMHSQITVASGGATAGTIAEAGPKVVARMSFSPAIQLQEHKTICIVVVSQELTRYASNTLFSQELANAVAAETDRAFIQRLITSGLPVINSSGSNEAAILIDIQIALRDMDLQSSSKLFLIVDAKNTAKSWATQGGAQFVKMTPLGGELCGMPVLVTDSLPAGTILVADASQIGASASALTLDASGEATVEMDTTPQSPPTGTAVLTPLWQNNLLGLRATRYWAAERLRNNAVVQIVGASYGGSP
jgi:hypothetical protein